MTEHRPGEDATFEVVSCNSDWVFELEKKKFLRLPRGSLNRELLHFEAGSWVDYDELCLADDSLEFVIYLNAEKTSMVRSFRHVEPCSRCETGGDENLTREIPKVVTDLS